MFGHILQKFSEKSPVTVMVQGLLERLLHAEKIETWFEQVSEVQYTKKILFSSLIALMLEVVCRVRKNVYSAYLNSTIDATRQAVYDKLKHVELSTSQELVRYIGSESEQMIREMKTAPQAPLVAGYRVKFLDGNCIEASEKRLKALRRTGAGALPGKALVVFDQQWGIVSDVFPCEDGHAQERSLLPQGLETVQPGEIWCADRNFCVLSFLFGIAQKQAYFVIRQHASTPFTPVTEKVFIGKSDTGTVYEQRVQLCLEGETLEVRRIIVDLHKTTRNGDQQLCIFTNLPPNVDALTIAYIYRKRWTIETAFQKLEKYLHSEINALGYPKAALFGFCMALVAFNLYAVVMAAIQAAFPDQDIQEEVSDYYIAEEIATTFHGMNLILEEQDWTPFVICDRVEFSALLVELASKIVLKKFKKHKRGPKKPPPPKTEHIGKPHVSTARLLS